MAETLRLSWLFCILFFLLLGLRGEPREAEHAPDKRSVSSEQPRMLSDNGHLVFTTGDNKEIRFQTSTSGQVKVNNEDLTQLLSQIKTNKEDIDNIKTHGGGISPELNNRLNQLDTKISGVENRVTTVESIVQKVSCSSNPCQNGGTCLNTLNSYHCLCPSNWAGSNCATDVNECQILSGTLQGCQNGATCLNTAGSFSCTCSPEWSGTHCTVRYDDCRNAGQDLCVHGTCIDADRVVMGQPKYKCICESGWEAPAGSAACIADVNECNLPNKPCSTNPAVPCFNTQGSFYCGACPAGWLGNGYSCQDVDECLTNNGGCSTTPMVQCLNTMGSFHCGTCPPGYEGDGRTCTQANICANNNGGCYPLATCSSNPGSNLPICSCPPGYTGNGFGATGCTEISNICQTNNPCVNGQCAATTSAPGYVCNCNSGWQGVNCDQNINECASNPCQNGGNCTDVTNGFTCTCTSQWTGPLCQTPQQVCGGDLTGPAGSFSYPNTPGHDEYDHQVSCAWVVRVAQNKIVRITFPYFDLENSANCNYDFLQIHDGDSASAHMMGKYCGQNNPKDLNSSHNALYFWFRSDHSVNAGGFTITWEAKEPVCGGVLTAPYGNINSPGYPGNYPPNRDCYWTVTVEPGLLITFAFGTLSLEQHPDCNFDFLEIRDGLLSGDPVLGKYCSTASPAPLQTTGPAAWIHFHSDFAVSDRGFHITYTTSPSDPGCGGTFTESEGIIISPNWPNNYAHNRQCIYLIRLPVGEKLTLNFTHMDLELHSGCTFDYVEVREGQVETDPLIGRYCGNTLPAPILSSSNSLWIRFKSDSSVSRAGFRAVYTVACGGTLSGTGQLRSPYHPNAYPHNKVCEWVINQPEGYVVTLDFLSFDVEGNSCHFDFVEVRDGSTSSSPLLGTFCGAEIPPRLQSTQRSLYIKFKTDSSVNNHGFEAAYGSALEDCGDTLTSPSGTITSPGHPTSYPHGANCTWYISALPGNLVRLSFDSFNLEYHDNCNYDYVEVYDNGTVQTGTKIGRYCGRSVPPSITSTDNLLTLLFVTDSSLAKEGFSASYVSIDASTDCGETFTSPTGSLSSPNYPSNYPNNRDCVFKIILQVNVQIMLNFTNFELEGSPPSCGLDFVEIRDGGYETSPLIGKFCGTQRPPVLVSHSNRLWVRFRSDSTVTRSGFSAHWDGSQTGCGGTMTTASGGFSSPNYPLPYHPNSECYWNVKTSQGSQVLLSFSDFHLETSNNLCLYDYLAVYDGNSSSAPRLAELCGSQLPNAINSSRNELYIKLRTDSSVSTGGFLASYTTKCNNIVISRQYAGVLESLNFPNNYPENSVCSWTIQGSSGNTINYTFTAFELESTSNCNFDYIKLYNGPNEQAPLIGTFCGYTPPPANTTTSSALTVVFRTDRSVSKSGFQMMWYQNGCGGDLSGPSGSFNSPGYPNKYPENRECLWYISTSPGSSITLTIHEFDVEFHQDCSYDVLEVYGGPDLSAPRLAQLCTTTSSPMRVSSTGHMITVLFKSDAYVSGRGFNASWTEVAGGCGGPVTAPSGEIHSPLYPNSYPNNVDCSWVISVESHHRVFLSFTDLDIESQSTCSWDYVAIYDGPTTSSPLLARVCGNSLPFSVTSTQNIISVRFRSDSSQNHRGFSAHFSEACGTSIITDNEGGAIASPQYPSPYPANQNCSWIIKAQEPFNHVTLSFTDFELEMVNTNCSHDAVEILDGDNYQAPSIGRYCGSEVPHPVTSFSNSLVVNFISDSVISRKGFRATYTTSTSSCGGELVMESGAFNSPNYPDAYPPNVECVWTIKSSPGNRLQLSFIVFHLQGGANCLNDYLEIREGNSTGHLVDRFCGNSLPANYTSVIGHILWVKFVSDEATSGAGFRATFSHLYGNDLTGDYGQIASPLYPRTYPSNADYRWTITVEGDSFVQIRFLDMDIEDLYDCFYDYLKIFDGSSVHYYPLGTFCGLGRPPLVRSSGSTITLQFRSDTVVGGRGFLVEWTAIQDSGPPPTITPGACGGMLMTGASPSFLFSPGWPNNYPEDQDCTWLIRSPDSTVEFNVLSLDMEDYPPVCYFDSLVIRDGETSLSPVLATSCGRDPPGPLHSTGDTMFIHFSSDNSISGRGFNASYSKGCGGLLHVDRGVLSSPHYPQNYLPQLNCSWHVMVTPGFRISVTFQSPFQIQGYGTECSLGDYIELRNGPDSSSPSLGPRVCGSSPPSLLQTTDNHLFVRFLSDASNEATGFKLTFEAHSQACGGFVELNDNDPPGYITSPNYPQNYPQNIDCIWVIAVPNGEAVQLDFEDEFYIEHTQGCMYDYLEVRDGSTSSADLISHLCGNTKPSTQHSTGPAMLLRFRTDGSVTHKGFKAKFSKATCSGTYRGQRGTLSSPGFPTSHYPDSSSCEWYLEGPTGHYLTLSYGNFSLQSSSGCSADYVEIREYNASGRLLGRHCGNNLPASMETSDSFAYVRFVSDAGVNAAGFSLSFEASVEACGGELNAPSGTISSPNYPNLYPHSRLCRWELVVSPGHRITFTINDLRLEGSGSSCAYDYVDVLNGLADNAPRLQRFCGTVPVGTQVRSSGNTMTIVFRTDASVSNGGFMASYSSDEPAVCGGILDNPVGGNITSPDYLVSNYSNNLNCEWLIQNPRHINSSIVVIITDLHLENHQTCESDYLKFRLGNADGELLARFCGQTTPTIPIVVFTPELWIQFQTDDTQGDLGFKATYMFSECGGWQVGEGGVISSPNYPNTYPGPSRCAWLLEAPMGHTITLTFSYFNLELHPTCGWDSVSVFNGGSPGSPVIGHYCGTTSPGTIRSGSNKLAVVFLADHSVSKGGFVASWSADSSGCGGVIHADTGTIKSPNYPQNFPANVECSWQIIAHEGNHLEMSFNSDFQIPDSSGTCQSSYIKVFSGQSQNSDALLSTGCGSVAPGRIIAPANIMTARFQATGATGRGFAASFTTSCGANFTASSGRVVSPNYPADYPDGANCNYVIDAGQQTVIVVTFKVFQVEAHSTCQYDGLKIYNLATGGSPIATLCGTSVPGPFSTFGPMSLHFYSDSVVSDTGFMAEYRAIPCGGFFNSTMGTVSSPALAMTNYHHNINCTYHIMVAANRVVDLKFNTFSLEASSSCRYDFVAVYDGPDTLSPLLGTFCGAVLPPNLRSSTNQLFIVFRTDSSVSGLGWRAVYSETLGAAQGCGGYLSMPMGMFGSPDPNQDGRYEPKMDCLWTIDMTLNRAINLTFSSFELESSSTCRYDYVKVYDGDNVNFPLVGTFCGNTIPAYFVSSGNFLTIHFVTDSSVQQRGFNATYRAVPLLCGGTLNATTSIQTLNSPYFPNAYPPFITCRWMLDAPAQETVLLSVQNFMLQPSQSCSANFLEMRDWPVGDYGQSHKFCASDGHPPDFYSYSRTVLVYFKSDAFMAGNGLRFTYQIANCSRIYEQEYGYLKSPGWPNPYPHSVDCTIILKAPQSNHISLFFNSFDVETHSTCSFDYLEVRNGSTAQSPLIGRFCGSTLPNPVFPQSNLLYLRFKSDMSHAREGFEVTWTSSPHGCGGTLYGEHGSFSSPNYPGTYPNHTHCEWSVRAPRGRVVTVTFAQISIDDPGDCQNNFLKLYDGPDASSRPVGPYCGVETNIAPFTATSHHVFIVFQSQYVNLPSGFRLTWSS
ncbi:cubilin [Solea senegalensis]|uniref:Cubilin n=2 Tax=Solea senegalensis TaxID=28829 RepID=A0AAV6TC67_SOLSE|nr:cubilin [Solea senegalensis]KAG7527098.1 cubilin [Solea senegalensis]